MAFGKQTRNRLSGLVSEARNLIANEFTQQFQSLYGISDKGDITPLDQLIHLDDTGLSIAALLRERIDYLVNTHPEDKDGIRSAVDRLAREQAFTVLNRLAAIRMAEKRGIIVESVGEGYQSKGFKVFEKVAGSGLGDTYHRYRRYMFCLFDELAVDLGILFDRSSPQGLIFPRETALQALLGLLNASDIDALWAEDETIGWIYQYYNDPAERKKMREVSSAPRNSRELAVRNQFFTPRYVVEFLTDNTLGRIWYEMTKGETRLKEQCRYLVRRPNEIFLESGEDVPEVSVQDSISKEELLRQPVYIPHRPIKDPREIRLLDPACGSMHFGLYAFDIYEVICEEAWNLGLASLRDDYPEKEAFLREIPRLIIENNIHGIDIDPRCTQIARLSLWLRAQKSWQVQKISADQRPHILRSNIVCAEPMPGSRDFLRDFNATLSPPLLGQLLEQVFNHMQLAGEAGSLLKIEEEITTLVKEAKKRWISGSKAEQIELGLGLETKPQQGNLLLDLSGISDERFWDSAEERIYAALHAYAEQTETIGYQRRLFAEDAARGFAFIDICRKRYDLVVMNPPFGDASKSTKVYIDSTYLHSKGNLLANFIEMATTRLSPEGLIGAIVSRTCFFLKTFTDFRETVLYNSLKLRAFADLGLGVLEAMVETAASVWTKTSYQEKGSLFFRALVENDKSGIIRDGIAASNRGILNNSSFIVDCKQFRYLEESPFVYWISESVVKQLASLPKIDPAACSIRVGLQTGDDFRFLRMWNEVPTSALISASGVKDYEAVRKHCLDQSSNGKSWGWYSKTDKASLYLASIHLCVNWANNGCEIKASHVQRGDSISRYVRSEESYFKQGISYMLRSVRLVPYTVPIGTIPTAGRSQVYPVNGCEDWVLILLASNIATCVSRFRAENFSGPKFQNTMVGSVPYILPSNDLVYEGLSIVKEGRRVLGSRFQSDESEIYFTRPTMNKDEKPFIVMDRHSLLGDTFDKKLAVAYGLNSENFRELMRDLQESVMAPSEEPHDEEESGIGEPYYTSPAESEMSYYLGSTFGRWDIRFAIGESISSEISDPFAPLPVCPPGMLQNASGLPVEPNEIPANYPLRISWPGILVDDENHPEDIITRIREVVGVIWKGSADDVERNICQLLGVKSVRDYFCRSTGFFAVHLKRYSKSRRQAPIYWPLSTANGSYTLWIYYHRLSDQTLHTALADFVDPKIKAVRTEMSTLRESGSNRVRLEELQNLEKELIDFRAEIEKIIKLPWKPNLNDGVLITASPLWKFFRLSKWQKDLKACWQKMEKGDYDWAHMAYSIWPKRVEDACRKDRSIAIAHNMEHLCDIPAQKTKKNKKKSAVVYEEPEE